MGTFEAECWRVRATRTSAWGRLTSHFLTIAETPHRAIAYDKSPLLGQLVPQFFQSQIRLGFDPIQQPLPVRPFDPRSPAAAHRLGRYAPRLFVLLKMLAGRRPARMSKPYSDDLRIRAVSAVAGGLSRHKASEVFSVGVSSVVRWVHTNQFLAESPPNSLSVDNALASATKMRRRDFLAGTGAVLSPAVAHAQQGPPLIGVMRVNAKSAEQFEDGFRRDMARLGWRKAAAIVRNTSGQRATPTGCRRWRRNWSRPARECWWPSAILASRSLRPPHATSRSSPCPTIWSRWAWCPQWRDRAETRQASASWVMNST